MSSDLKSDTKGAFMAKNGYLLKRDIDIYLEKACAHFQENNKHRRKYVLIDLSSIANFRRYIDTYAKLLSISFDEEIKIHQSTRDIEHINLFEIIDYRVRGLDYPLAFFVDDFLALGKNAMWKKYRNGSNDIFFDRSANIGKMCELD
jgi:hypothetical protein